jgi:mitogen-activated protein kinase kinase kinase
MNRQHNPTLSNLEEVEDEEGAAFLVATRQHSYHPPSNAAPTPVSSPFRMQGTYSSPAILANPKQPSTSTALSCDVYTRFMQRHRAPLQHDSSRHGEHDDQHASQGLGSLLEDNSDEEESGIGMSRLSLKDMKISLDTDVTIEPANDGERKRLEWQTMLASVLDGDVLKSEKTRIAIALESISSRRQSRHDDIWFGLRANLSGTTVREARKLIDEKRRRYAESVYADVMAFRVVTEEDIYAEGPLPSAISQVELLLRRLDAVEDLYPTLKALYKGRPIYGEPAFQTRRDALIAWTNLASALGHQLNSLKQWTGSDTLDITKSASTAESALAPIAHPNSQVDGSLTFVERVLKEESMHRMFEKKTLTTLHSFLKSTRKSLVLHAEIFRSLNLPMFREELVQLVSFPSRLVESILRVRLEYAAKVHDPEPMMIDQMIDDFRIAIGLACTIRSEYEVHVARDPTGNWILPPSISDTYDGVVLKAVKYLFRLMNWKFKITPVEDIDITGIHGQLFDEVSLKLTDGSRVVAEELW